MLPCLGVPGRGISSSLSRSRLPALLTMFIKWMAVQANGMRYRPNRWQNCSDWALSFSSFSLFYKRQASAKDKRVWKTDLWTCWKSWRWRHETGSSVEVRHILWLRRTPWRPCTVPHIHQCPLAEGPSPATKKISLSNGGKFQVSWYI